MTIKIEASIGPKNMVVFSMTKNSPPFTANLALLESLACFSNIQPLTRALTLAFAQRNIASHDNGMVNDTLNKVAFRMPNNLVVAINDPSATMTPNIASNIPANQYNLFCNIVIKKNPQGGRIEKGSRMAK